MIVYTDLYLQVYVIKMSCFLVYGCLLVTLVLNVVSRYSLKSLLVKRTTSTIRYSTSSRWVVTLLCTLSR